MTPLHAGTTWSQQQNPYAIGPSARSRPPRSANDDARHLNSQLWYSNRTSNIRSERAGERATGLWHSSRAIEAAKRLCVDGIPSSMIVISIWCNCGWNCQSWSPCCVYPYSSSSPADQGGPPPCLPRDILSRPTSHRKSSASDYAHHPSFPTIRRPPAKGSFIVLTTIQFIAPVSAVIISIASILTQYTFLIAAAEPITRGHWVWNKTTFYRFIQVCFRLRSIFPKKASLPRTFRFRIVTVGQALLRFRLRNQSSARTRCKLFLHRAVRWSSECSLTYFFFYVVLVADDHNFLLVQSISHEYMLNIKKELLDNIKRIVSINSATFVYKNLKRPLLRVVSNYCVRRVVCSRQER